MMMAPGLSKADEVGWKVVDATVVSASALGAGRVLEMVIAAVVKMMKS
jgi:hypothetical protein